MSCFDLRSNLIERRNVEVTPDLAKHYLKFNTYHAQRAIRPKHVDELAEKMSDGRFRFGEISFGLIDGQDVMMNGQHQCEAIIKSGETIPCVVEKYRCRCKLDLSDLFCQFEHLARSQSDINKARAGALSLKWPLNVVRLVITAASIEYSMSSSDNANKRKSFIPGSVGSLLTTKNPLTKERRAALLDLYLKEGEFVNRILTGATMSHGSRHLERGPIAYVMFLTWRKNQSESLTFWSRVRDGEYLTMNMPEMKLREFLMSVNSHATPYSYRIVKPHEYICRCISAWNAFRSGKKTSLAYSPTKDIPAVK